MSDIDHGMVKQSEKPGRERDRDKTGMPGDSGKFMILPVCVSFPVLGEAIGRV